MSDYSGGFQVDRLEARIAHLEADNRRLRAERIAAAPGVCRNCAGQEWVCENHMDRPWDDSAEHGCECGAGAPCPVCNREMACAGFVDAERQRAAEQKVTRLRRTE